METGYRDGEPDIGSVHSAFRDLSDIEEFVEDQMGSLDGEYEIYEIWGELISDDGGPDGLQILVEDFDVHYI